MTRVPGVISSVLLSDLLIHGCVPHEEEAEEAGRPIPGGVGAQLGGHYGHLQQQGQGLHSGPGGEITWTPGPSRRCSSRAVDTPAHISCRAGNWVVGVHALSELTNVLYLLALAILTLVLIG